MSTTALLLALAYATLMFWCLWKLTTTAKKVHAEIDALERKAKEARSLDELEAAEVSLRIYAAKDMPHHRAFTHRIKEIRSYLQGRKKGLL